MQSACASAGLTAGPGSWAGREVGGTGAIACGLTESQEARGLVSHSYILKGIGFARQSLALQSDLPSITERVGDQGMRMQSSRARVGQTWSGAVRISRVPAQRRIPGRRGYGDSLRHRYKSGTTTILWRIVASGALLLSSWRTGKPAQGSARVGRAAVANCGATPVRTALRHRRPCGPTRRGALCQRPQSNVVQAYGAGDPHGWTAPAPDCLTIVYLLLWVLSSP